MTPETASTLVSVSIASLLALGGVLLAAGVAWGTLRTEVKQLRAEITRLTKILSSISSEHDGDDIRHHERWHDHDRQIGGLDRRLAVLESHVMGVPQASGRETTDRITLRPDTGRHRSPAADESK